MSSARRRLEGQALADLLKELATICAIADGLRLIHDPPLTNEHLQAELTGISLIASKIALTNIGATNEEWRRAIDFIE
jgi:hypothetical protein